jgi:hypothetical protein
MCPSPSCCGLESLLLSIPLQRSSLVDPILLYRFPLSLVVSPRLHGFSPLSLRCPALLPSLSFGCAAGCSAPRCSSSRSTVAVVPFQTTARRWRNRADGDEEWRNRGGISTRIRRQGAALPLRRAGSAPTLKRRLGDD